MSRYYDTATGRFVNADHLAYLTLETLNGLNLYAYCLNNPVMGYDPSGTVAVSIIAMIISVIIGAAVGFGTATYLDYKDDGEVFNGSVPWYGYVGATIAGGAIGGALGYVALRIGGFLSASFEFTIPTITTLGNGTLAFSGVAVSITGVQIAAGVGATSLTGLGIFFLIMQKVFYQKIKEEIMCKTMNLKGFVTNMI